MTYLEDAQKNTVGRFYVGRRVRVSYADEYIAVNNTTTGAVALYYLPNNAPKFVQIDFTTQGKHKLVHRIYHDVRPPDDAISYVDDLLNDKAIRGIVNLLDEYYEKDAYETLST